MDIYADNAGTTGVIAVGDSITSEIDTIGDKDWFAVDLEGGNNYRFTMTTEALSDLGTLSYFAIEGLIDPNGRNISHGKQADTPHETVAEIYVDILETGRYYMPLRGAPTYLNTTAAQGAGGYRLDVTQLVDTDDHGSTVSTATPLMLGQTLTGRINDGVGDIFTDRDWFEVNLEAGQIFDVATTFQPENLDGYGYYYSILHTPQVYQIDDATGNLTEYSGVVAQQTGRYIIEMTGYYSGDYSLEISTPWTFDTTQIAQFIEDGWPQVVTAGNAPRYDYYGNSFEFFGLGNADHIIADTGSYINIIGGGGRDVMLGGDGFDLLVAETGGPTARLAAEFQINALYQIMLGRAIDATGEAALTRDLDTYETNGNLHYLTSTWAAKVLGSAEFTAHNGGAVDMTDEGSRDTYLRTLYDGLRDGPPSTLDLNTWLYFTNYNPDAASVAVQFATSREAYQRFAPTIMPDLLEAPDMDDFALIYSAYETLLDRTPDATGLTGWGMSLMAGDGIEDVVTGILQSPEYVIKHKQAIVDNPQPLERMLENAMSRLEAPDAETFNAWMRTNAADDVLVAGGGNDLLVGGILSDTFVFGKGDDFNRVLDFEAWDRIDLRAFDFASADDALAAFYAQDGKAVFNEEGTVIVLYGTDPDMLTADTFLI